MLENLRKARIDLKNRKTRQNHIGNDSAIDDLLRQAQIIQGEMYEAKKKAAAEAAAPFMKKLEALDSEMAMFAKLMA